MFIAALFKVAKTCKQPKYLSTDKCINVRFHYMWELWNKTNEQMQQKRNSINTDDKRVVARDEESREGKK